MLRKLPVVTETPFIPGTPGEAAYQYCPPPTPPPPPPPFPGAENIPGAMFDASGCWIDHAAFMAGMQERGLSGIEIPPGCHFIFYQQPGGR